MITRIAYQNNLVVTANYYHSFNVIPESVPGYKPLFAFIARLDNPRATALYPSDTYDTQNGFILAAANVSSSDITVSIRIIVVYIRQ